MTYIVSRQKSVQEKPHTGVSQLEEKACKACLTIVRAWWDAGRLSGGNSSCLVALERPLRCSGRLGRATASIRRPPPVCDRPQLSGQPR